MAVETLELESRPPLTGDEFHALAERLGWDEDTRVELLDGELVWTSPTNDPHAVDAPRADHYRTARATPQDILLLIEVADTTLRTDLGRKARIYASAGIVEYWVVDLNSQMVYVHRAPVDGAYRTRTELLRGAELSAAFAPTVRFNVPEIFG